MRVLIAHGEGETAETLRRWLDHEGMAVDVVHEAAALGIALAVHEYDVVVLSDTFPPADGPEMWRALTTDSVRPALLMTVRGAHPRERIDALLLGADDVLSGTYERAELWARIWTLARRPRIAIPAVYVQGDLRMDPGRREVTRAGKEIDLTRKEFAALEVLLRAGGVVVSAEYLLEKAWDANANPLTSTVKTTVSTLRRKLGDPDPIRTVVGVGYAIDSAVVGRGAVEARSMNSVS